MTEAESESIHLHLRASFALAGYLLEAHSEEAAILAAMRVSTDLLGAIGSAFVPFSEWKQSVPPLKYGEAAFLEHSGWQTRLSAPATRHVCRVCDKRQAGSECVLLQEPADAQNVFCVALRCGGREVGVTSYFFSASPKISNDQHQFLAEMVRLTDLALDALRVHTQDVEAARRAFKLVDLKETQLILDSKSEALLEQLEYKAVLDERTRLAREIHDGLAQTLAFLKLEAARLQTYVSNGEVDAVTRTLQACYQTLSDAYLDARQAIDNLRRIPDESFGDWLEGTAADFKTLTGLEIDVSNVHLDHVFSPNVKAQLIRIVQEALTNIRKHAQACTVTVSAFERNGDAILEVHDNGRGFVPEELQPVSQYGLRSMRERAESIGADFQIISAPGAGTTVRLQIPIREQTNP
ncbi:MAG: sensor histidine kinase [Anaerolineales bacterium]|nr:sensor histidine kinase [Anaerolineales bacterium]